MRRLGRLIVFVLLVQSLSFGRVDNALAQAKSSNTTREILLTSAYGVLAGAIVGLASLAFVSSPADHLRNVAMGASIGLYVGIALGVYIAYGLPAMEASSKETPEEKKEDEAEAEKSLLPPEPPKDSPKLKNEAGEEEVLAPQWLMPQFALGPSVSPQGQPEGWLLYGNLIRLRF